MAVISRDEAFDKFDTYLDDVYGNVQITNYMFSTAQALKCVDEILYKEMFNEWCNDYGYTETDDGDYIISDSIKVNTNKKLIHESKKHRKFDVIFDKIISEIK